VSKKVSNRRNRWLVNLILIIACLSFAGSMIALPFASGWQRERAAREEAASSPSTAMPGAELTDEQRADLEAQARGYELVLEREPDNPTVLRGLLEVRLQLGDVQGSIMPLERLAELNPDQTDYTVLLAQAREQVGDREGAAQAYRTILSTQPGNMNALKGLVQLLLQEDRPEAAVGLLEDTLRLADNANQVQPGSVDVASVQLLLGQAYAESGRYDESLAVYDQAAASNPTDFRPLLAKALVLQALGRNDEANPLFDQAESMAPAQYRDQIKQLAAGESPDDAAATEAGADLPETNDVSPSPAPESSASPTAEPTEGN
jgi:tetratricopeptide (TPR) repeat protein